MIQCNNTDCAAMEGHVPACPLSAMPTPFALAEMSQQDLDALRDRLSGDHMLIRERVMPVHEESHPDDERMVMSFDLDRLPTPQAVDIVSRLLPEWVAGFLDANARYARVGNELGYKGVLPDINRKFGVLKARVWDGQVDTGREPTRGVILDLVGHLFLMLHMMDDEEGLSVQALQERARSMEKHPAGKGRRLPSEDALSSVMCTETIEMEDGPQEVVSCIRGLQHAAKGQAHFGRRGSGAMVQWDSMGNLINV